jgi:hypothetical protein
MLNLRSGYYPAGKDMQLQVNKLDHTLFFILKIALNILPYVSFYIQTSVLYSTSSGEMA